MQVYFQLFANDIKQHYVWLKRQDSPSLHGGRRGRGHHCCCPRRCRCCCFPRRRRCCCPRRHCCCCPRRRCCCCPRRRCYCCPRRRCCCCPHRPCCCCPRRRWSWSWSLATAASRWPALTLVGRRPAPCSGIRWQPSLT